MHPPVHFNFPLFLSHNITTKFRVYESIIEWFQPGANQALDRSQVLNQHPNTDRAAWPALILPLQRYLQFLVGGGNAHFFGKFFHPPQQSVSLLVDVFFDVFMGSFVHYWVEGV